MLMRCFRVFKLSLFYHIVFLLNLILYCRAYAFEDRNFVSPFVSSTEFEEEFNWFEGDAESSLLEKEQEVMKKAEENRVLVEDLFKSYKDAFINFNFQEENGFELYVEALRGLILKYPKLSGSLNGIYIINSAASIFNEDSSFLLEEHSSFQVIFVQFSRLSLDGHLTNDIDYASNHSVEVTSNFYSNFEFPGDFFFAFILSSEGNLLFVNRSSLDNIALQKELSLLERKFLVLKESNLDLENSTNELIQLQKEMANNLSSVQADINQYQREKQGLHDELQRRIDERAKNEKEKEKIQAAATLIGAGIGSTIGGPVGGAIGGLVGSIIGGLF